MEINNSKLYSTDFQKIVDFWTNYSLNNIVWDKKFDNCLRKNTSEDIRNEFNSKFKWFKGGRCDLKKTLFSNKKAFEIFITYFDSNRNIKKDITYQNFLVVCAEYVKKINSFNNISNVMIIGTASPETTTIMVSTALTGKCHSVLFEDLSTEAILSRIRIFNPELIFVRSTFNLQSYQQIKKYCNQNRIIIEKYSDLYLKNGLTKNQINLNCDQLKEYKDIPNIHVSNDQFLFCLFTSGSTGKPKAIWHSFIQYLVFAKYTFQKFFLDSGAGGGIFCATDAAWINGHTYAVYGPLITNTRTIFIDNLNTLQNPRNLELFLSLTNPSFLYSSVTLLRAIRSIALITNSINLSKVNSLEGVGSCGEPLADEVGKWALKFFNCSNKYIVNTYFQTETGGVITAPLLNDNENINFANVGKSNFPVEVFIDKNDNSLYIPYPWPGCFSKVTSDKKPNYFNKNNEFLLHDQGFFDHDSFLFIGGRTDDVINVSGHRISTAEIESTCIDSQFNITEAAAVGVDDEITGSKIVLFCIRGLIQQLDKETIKNYIKQKLTPFHKPWKIILISELPKTKSGKIARRILRKVASSDFSFENEDLSTITNYKSFRLSLKKMR